MALLALVSVFIIASFTPMHSYATNFNRYYSPLWGLDHISMNQDGTQVQLLMDQSSGAGFRSKMDYESGLFQIRMKIPEGKSEGIVSCFYLTSVPDNQYPGNHFELDFEFIGTNGTLQTNVYNNDEGHREQSFKLPFDPSQDFHTYGILWNTYQIVFLIDGIPVRVFKNNNHHDHGVDYPFLPMHIEASIWNADWAGPVNWTSAPFITYYQGFKLWACEAQSNCNSQNYFWNHGPYRRLNHDQRLRMANFRHKYMTYDYCSNPQTYKPECSYNN